MRAFDVCFCRAAATEKACSYLQHAHECRMLSPFAVGNHCSSREDACIFTLASLLGEYSLQITTLFGDSLVVDWKRLLVPGELSRQATQSCPTPQSEALQL